METKEKWTETTNYENFLRNCRKYGMSKRLWIRSGRPNQKPNGEKINFKDWSVNVDTILPKETA